MSARRVFVSFAMAMISGITVQSTAFTQEYRGSWEQQQACTPDVWRLCSAQVPSVDRIVACLRRNTPQLSDRCRAVFAERDASPREEDRDNRQRRYERDYGQRRYDQDYEPRRPYDREYGPRPSYGPRPYDYDDE
jgi:hypothetical protein